MVRLCWLNVERGIPWFHCPDNYHSSSPSDSVKSPCFVSRFVWSWPCSRIRNIIVVVMFSQFFRPCRTLIWATPERLWRSLALLSQPLGPVFSGHVCGDLFGPRQTTRANPSCCSFNTQNLWVLTAWFAAVRLRPIPPTLGVVTNTEGFSESWNLSCISVHSSLPIFAYM